MLSYAPHIPLQEFHIGSLSVVLPSGEYLVNQRESMVNRVGELWRVIRGALSDDFTFAGIKTIVGACGLPVEQLAHLQQGSARSSTKGDLVSGIDTLVLKLTAEDQDRFVLACIEEMIRRKEAVQSELQRLLGRVGWELNGHEPVRKTNVSESELKIGRTVSAYPSINELTADSPLASPLHEFMAADTKTTGERVFIGHGGSHLWLILQNFLTQELGLKCDEFKREPTAGFHNVERLEQMLDAACFAFVVMTAEDEYADGTKRARQNVIHEAGLFQGRLGFKKAIILLEDGCADFSNIDGLTHIPFPKGNIMACSEEIRRTLKREGVLKT
jgi:predicted nucleotide-binding protein